MATTGHETETVNVAGLKGALQQYKTDITDKTSKSLVGYYTCGTAAATAAKTITASYYTLLQGGSIKVKFTYKNTANDATLKIGGADAKPLFYAGRRAGSSNSWEAGEVVEIFYDGTNYYANNVMGGGAGDGAFDISVYNAVGGTPAQYASLSAALGTNGANVPASVRKGGMSVKFVCNSDNNYVQYRLIPDEWSTNVYDWALMEGDVYIDNPEFIEVRTDSEKRILWAIKADGSVYWGAGVPQQVIDYVQTKIDELSLDEYGDIVSFLNNLEEGDKTLQQLLDEKVNTETNKSLIQSDVADNVRFSENPEWAEVTLDSENKVLEGIREDGRKVINLPVVLSEIPENIQKELLPLWGKKLAVTGDSICAGVGFSGGYARIIGDMCNMQVQNIAVAGGTITYGTTSSGGNRFWICDSINDLDADADYILIEGGVNDASLYLTLGSITMDSNHLYDAEVDKETFCGAFEKMCRDLIYRFKGKKYGYIAVHSSAWNYMPARDNDASFYYAAKNICAKYGVPFCDLTSQIPMFAYLPANDILRTTYTDNGDGWHPNEEGYKKYYIDKIISWMKTL